MKVVTPPTKYYFHLDYDHYNEYEEAIDALLIYIEDQPVACGALKTLASQKDWV